jgi:hypothetical protein
VRFKLWTVPGMQTVDLSFSNFIGNDTSTDLDVEHDKGNERAGEHLLFIGIVVLGR